MTGTILRTARMIALLAVLGASYTNAGAQSPLDGADALQSTSEEVRSSDAPKTPAGETQDKGVAPAAAKKPAATVPSTPMSVSIAEARQKLAGWRIDLDHATAVLQRQGLTRKDLNDLQSGIEALSLEARELRRAVMPSVEALDARLKKLEPSKKDAVESADIKTRRAEVTEELANIQGLVKQISVIGLRTEEIAAAIDDRRRTIFAERLFEYHQSILDPRVWGTAFGDLPAVLQSLVLLASDWHGLVTAKYGNTAFLLLIGLILVIFVVVSVAQRIVLHLAVRDPEATDPPQLRKVWAALTILVINAVLPLAGVIVFFAVLEALGVSPRRIDQLARTVFFTALALAAANGLIRAVLAPGKPGWRMVPLTDRATERLNLFVILIAAILGLNILLDGVARNLLSPLTITVVLHGSLAIAFHVLILICLRIIAKGRTEPKAAAGDAAEQRSGRSMFWRLIIPIAFLASVVGLLATLVGYISFGWFLATQIVWIAAVLGLLHLLLIFVDELFTTGLRASVLFGTDQTAELPSKSAAGEQFGVIVSGILRLILIAVAATLVLSPWGVRSSKLFGSLEAVFFGIQVGDVTFSLSTILIALAIFAVGMLATRSIQRWMEQKLLPRTRLDVGLKTSIRTAIGYVGIAIAAIIAFSYAGLDLQNVAIVAGALSVGIGFGLQSIVNNFVSGLILLAERPIKVGDWIVVGGDQGYVRKINVRATEIETFDRASVIVPNSDLISGVVTNWMHNDSTGRIIIGVGVAYDSNPDQVRDILLECAREHQMVLAYPAPNVYFMEFGASSLDFQLRCYLSNIDYALSAASDIRFAIFRNLGEAGIEIPFPQRDVNLRDMDKLEEIWAAGNTSGNRHTPATDK